MPKKSCNPSTQTFWKEGYSAKENLLEAIESCNSLRLEKMLREKSLASYSDAEVRTYLHVAVKKKYADIVKILLFYGADMLAKDENDRLPIHYAAENGDVVCFKLLLNLSPVINFQSYIQSIDNLGQTPLGLAKRSRLLINEIGALRLSREMQKAMKTGMKAISSSTQLDSKATTGIKNYHIDDDYFSDSRNIAKSNVVAETPHQTSFSKAVAKALQNYILQVNIKVSELTSTNMLPPKRITIIENYFDMGNSGVIPVQHVPLQYDFRFDALAIFYVIKEIGENRYTIKYILREILGIEIKSLLPGSVENILAIFCSSSAGAISYLILHNFVVPKPFYNIYYNPVFRKAAVIYTASWVVNYFNLIEDVPKKSNYTNVNQKFLENCGLSIARGGLLGGLNSALTYGVFGGLWGNKIAFDSFSAAFLQGVVCYGESLEENKLSSIWLLINKFITLSVDALVVFAYLKTPGRHLSSVHRVIGYAQHVRTLMIFKAIQEFRVLLNTVAMVNYATTKILSSSLAYLNPSNDDRLLIYCNGVLHNEYGSHIEQFADHFYVGTTAGEDIAQALSLCSLEIKVHKSIVINSTIRWTKRHDLSLTSRGNIILENSAFLKCGGLLTLQSIGNKEGQVLFYGNAKVQMLNNSSINIYYNPVPNDKSKFSHKYHNQYPHYKHVTPMSACFSYMYVNDFYDLQDIEKFLSGDYALSGDIDASITRKYLGGFKPLFWEAKDISFSGRLDGQGYAIRNLYIKRPEEDDVGIFSNIIGSRLNYASVKNLKIKNAYIEGDHRVGVIAGNIIYANLSNIEIIESTVKARAVVGSIAGTLSNSEIYKDTLKYNALVVEATEGFGNLIGALRYSTCIETLEKNLERTVTDCAAIYLSGNEDVGYIEA